jgi:hypothetical protein
VEEWKEGEEEKEVEEWKEGEEGEEGEEWKEGEEAQAKYPPRRMNFRGIM